jgi:hypothetical protein
LIEPFPVPSSRKCSAMSPADLFGPSRLWITRISPIEHQKTHELSRVFMDKTRPADNDKVPHSG